MYDITVVNTKWTQTILNDQNKNIKLLLEKAADYKNGREINNEKGRPLKATNQDH